MIKFANISDVFRFLLRVEEDLGPDRCWVFPDLPKTIVNPLPCSTPTIAPKKLFYHLLRGQIPPAHRVYSRPSCYKGCVNPYHAHLKASGDKLSKMARRTMLFPEIADAIREIHSDWDDLVEYHGDKNRPKNLFNLMYFMANYLPTPPDIKDVKTTLKALGFTTTYPEE